MCIRDRFYIKGIVPPSVKIQEIYRGVIPFILIIIAVVILVTVFPVSYTHLLRIVQKQTAPHGSVDYEFHIRDTGIGMSSAFQEHIFEQFAREETSTVSKIQGTGLGMAITKNLVDMMGGSISVESEPGKGSEFTVSLRFPISGEQAAPQRIPQLEGLRALVADDDTDTCLNVSKMLRMIGMRSDWTTSGPVSYTHLDVYKRQVCQHTSRRRAPVQSLCTAARPARPGRTRSVRISVSYTHLAMWPGYHCMFILRSFTESCRRVRADRT